MANDAPLAPFGDGRGPGGRFARGNKGGPGNPHAQHVAKLRSALFEAVTPEDIRDVISALVTQARAGDVASIKELLQRLLGPPVDIDILDRIEGLEQMIGNLQKSRG